MLFIVGLGSATAPEIPDPVAVEEQLPQIVGMKPTPEILTVEYNAGALTGGGSAAEEESRLICDRLKAAARPLENQRAALALIFGGGRDIGVALDSALRIADQLPCVDPALFDGTTARDFWDGSLPSGSARLEVFLFTTD
ncbi:hypothetical protein I0Q12_02290 [Rhodococcus sp. CX]|uniref:hypothetical protein n=1 Tax=Rhodococcus sp. CX TaxID=2789880 RepID=UPI0018CCB30E|nr:hypothetical protein [Rhodococcus sp. CX]MBH0118427.1 hypothetical protein [Rhodococcus sp. CX]